MKGKHRFCILPNLLIARFVIVGFLLSGVGFVAPVIAGQAVKEPTTVSTDNEEPDKFEVTVKNGYIYVYSPRSITVQLYSILGQLITQQAVSQGTTRIKAPSRGVYILKAGSVTRRVTVN